MANRSTRHIYSDRIFSSPMRYGLSVPWIVQPVPFRRRRGVETMYMSLKMNTQSVVLVDNQPSSKAVYMDYHADSDDCDQGTRVKMVQQDDNYILVLDEDPEPDEQSEEFLYIIPNPTTHPEVFQLESLKYQNIFVTATGSKTLLGLPPNTPESDISYWTKEKSTDGGCTTYHIQVYSGDQPTKPPPRCIVYQEGKLQLASKATRPDIVEKYGQFLFH